MIWIFKMALSTILKKKCPTCGKDAIEKSSLVLSESFRLIELQCGHTTTSAAMKSAYQSVRSEIGEETMPYQNDGIMFAERANVRCLIADEQGLGKTVQAAGIIQLHLEELSPVLVITKTKIKIQMQRMMIRWAKTKKVQSILTSKEIAVPGFDIIVTTYDMLKNPEVFKFIKIKTIILDECQQIKNHLSGRAKAVQVLVKEHEIEHILGLSGTPIKNNAGEYFTILNLLDPMRFPTYQGYLDKYCDYYNDGWGPKVGGLKNAQQFHDDTKNIIIRRTKAEVLPDLPAKRRAFEHVELDRKLHKAYDAAMSELDDLMFGDTGHMSAMEIGIARIAIMTKLRKITGISKVDDCAEFVQDFLESSTERKITVFAHHHAVVNLLEQKINGVLAELKMQPAVMSRSGDILDVQKEFEYPQNRVLIASTIATGEGLNLQYCSDAIMLERQWNPANEEQAEDRFHRFGQLNHVTITYMLASGTIDEMFTELVESKRAIMASTLDNKEVKWDERSLMTELANILVMKGKKKWKM